MAFQNYLWKRLVGMPIYTKKNDFQFTVTKDETMKFASIIFRFGYNQRTFETDYQTKSPDLKCSLAALDMRRTRFYHKKSINNGKDIFIKY